MKQNTVHETHSSMQKNQRIFVEFNMEIDVKNTLMACKIYAFLDVQDL